ncbi:MAG TPA: hypothetical protein VGF93_18300 [Solirubrobacteraceae bacterium]
MTTSEVVSAIGRAARHAARPGGEHSEFSRGQLMSAFSASRHLSVELSRFPVELEAFAASVAGELAQARRVSRPDDLAAIAAELTNACDAPRIGNLVAAALELVRDDPAPAAVSLRASLLRSLRGLSDREVELLAEAIERPR